MPTTGSAQWPYPNSSATPDVPADMLALAQRIDLMSSGWTVTANATTRAALVTNGNAYEGLHVYQIDTAATYLYQSSTWKFLHQPVTVFTRANATIASGTTLLAIDFTDTPISGSAFTESNGVFTCVTAGTYRVSVTVSFAANGTGNRGLVVTHSVTSPSRGEFIAGGAGTVAQTLTAPWVVAFAVNDTLTVTARQDSGGTLGVSGDVIFERVA